MEAPVACVIATRSRAAALSRTLDSIRQRSVWPAQIWIIDGSDDDSTRKVVEKNADLPVVYHRATVSGAAPQRNEGVALVSNCQNYIWFLDDDVILEPNCLEHLWNAMQGDARLGAVNAMITNQSYATPGRISRSVYRLLHGPPEDSYAGRVIGPGMNFLPQDHVDLPEVVPVEWVNTTCTLYRREALPDPVFPPRFQGYSLMEDLSLSLEMRKRGWKLANARTARIFHDSQSGEHKSSSFALSRMELSNRHYIMRRLLEERAPSDYAKLALLECFFLASTLFNRKTWQTFPTVFAGKVRGLLDILTEC